MTVLFADVVRSMDIAASLDIERLHEIMTELVDRSAAVVQRYGGTVDKFTGDGIIALFAAPIALEDHAVRACLAALEIQQEAHRLAPEVECRDGTEFRLRVGLNSGRVIAVATPGGPVRSTCAAAQRPDDDWAMRDITALRMQTLLDRDLKDEVTYRDLMIRYRTMAESLGFDGHVDWAEAMADAIPAMVNANLSPPQVGVNHVHSVGVAGISV